MDALRGRIAGSVVARGDAGFESTCAALLWNQLQPERRPDAIVRVASADDVVAAVRFARGAGLRVAVRSGGHSWCGAPLRNGGLLLDLAALDELEIDGRIGRVGPALPGGDFVRRLADDGLCFPIGHCPTVAMGGYLLAGGLGWNAGMWGPACESIVAVDAVTADGRVVTATADHEADLLWAARGGGLGFPAIVTRFHLALHPLPRAITSVSVVHPLSAAAEVVEAIADSSLPPELEVVAVLGDAPPAVGAQCRGAGGRACIVSATAFADDTARASAVLGRLLRGRAGAGCLLRDEPRETPLDVLGATTAAAFPERHRHLAETAWIDAPPRDTVPIVTARMLDAPSHRSHVLCALPFPRPALDAAWSMTARMLVLAYAIWDDPAHDAANHAWHRELVAALDPLTVGRYAGETDVAARPAHAEAAFAPASWLRLQAIRRRWDPEHVLHGWF